MRTGSFSLSFKVTLTSLTKFRIFSFNFHPRRTSNSQTCKINIHDTICVPKPWKSPCGVLMKPSVPSTNFPSWKAFKHKNLLWGGMFWILQVPKRAKLHSSTHLHKLSRVSHLGEVPTTVCFCVASIYSPDLTSASNISEIISWVTNVQTSLSSSHEMVVMEQKPGINKGNTHTEVW